MGLSCSTNPADNGIIIRSFCKKADKGKTHPYGGSKYGRTKRDTEVTGASLSWNTQTATQQDALQKWLDGKPKVMGEKVRGELARLRVNDNDMSVMANSPMPNQFGLPQIKRPLIGTGGTFTQITSSTS